MSDAPLPKPGEDPQFDAVKTLIEHAAMNDATAVHILMAGILRFLRQRVGLPGVVMTFDELAHAVSQSQEFESLTYFINMEHRTITLAVIDAATRAGALAEFSRLAPNAECRVIDKGPEGKQ